MSDCASHRATVGATVEVPTSRMKREREDDEEKASPVDIVKTEQLSDEEAAEIKVEELVNALPPPNPKLSGALLSAALKGNLPMVKLIVSKGGMLRLEDVMRLCLDMQWKKYPEVLVEVSEGIPVGLGTKLSSSVVKATLLGYADVVKLLGEKGALLTVDGVKEIFKNMREWKDPAMVQAIKCIPFDSDALLKEVLIFSNPPREVKMRNSTAKPLLASLSLVTRVIVTTWHCTPLAIALIHGASNEVIEGLIHRGADPNYIFEGSVSVATSSGDPSVVQQPIKTTAMHEAFVPTVSFLNKSPCHPLKAEWKPPTDDDYVRMFKVLMKYGAKCDTLDGKGKSVVEFAVDLGFNEVAEVMLATL